MDPAHYAAGSSLVSNVNVTRPCREPSSYSYAGHNAPQRQQPQKLQRQQQYYAAAAAAAESSPLETSRTRSQSSDGRSSWRESGGEEMEGGGSSGGGGGGGKRRRISTNLRLSEFPQLAFLAQGAMCKCFVAQGNPSYPEPVVLKLAIENGPREAERDLNRELSLLQNLSHPNLTTLLGSGQTPKGKTFMVIEFLDGGTLRARMDAARGGLGFWPGMWHATELASVMKYLHNDAIPGMCVLHRDLKPDNLGFQGNRMKLVDLGLAKLIKRSENGVDEFYRMSGEVGSLRYMSPEVASQRPYNEKTDVHSFAVVLWELVTGWLPYAGLSPDMFMFQAVQHGQRPLMQFGWDPTFKALLASCWAEDPRNRPGFAFVHETLSALVAEKGNSPSAHEKGGAGNSGVGGGCCTPSPTRSGGFMSRLIPGRRKTRKAPPASAAEGKPGSKSER
eukprot:g7793.t2